MSSLAFYGSCLSLVKSQVESVILPPSKQPSVSGDGNKGGRGASSGSNGGKGNGGRGGRGGGGGRGSGHSRGRLVGSMTVVYYPGHHGECFRSKVTSVLPAAASTGRVWSCAEADGGCGRADSDWLLLNEGSPPLVAAPEEPKLVGNGGVSGDDLLKDLRLDPPLAGGVGAGVGDLSADALVAAAVADVTGPFPGDPGRLGYDFDVDFRDDWATDEDILVNANTPLASLGAISGLPSPISDHGGGGDDVSALVGSSSSSTGMGVGHLPPFDRCPPITLPEHASAMPGSSNMDGSFHQRGRWRSNSLNGESSPLSTLLGSNFNMPGSITSGGGNNSRLSWSSATNKAQQPSRVRSSCGLTPSWSAPVMPPVIQLSFLFVSLLFDATLFCDI